MTTSKIKLKRLVSDRKIKGLLDEMLGLLETDAEILDASGKVIYSKGLPQAVEHPITLSGEVVGQIRGDAKAGGLGSLIALLASLEMEKRSLSQETLGKYNELGMLYDMSEKIAGNLDPKEVGKLILDQVMGFMSADIGAILINDQRGGLKLLIAVGERGKGQASILACKGVCESVLEHGKAELVSDLASDSRGVKPGPVSSVLCAPLRVKNAVTGVVLLTSGEKDAYTAESKRVLTVLANQAAASIANAQLYDLLQSVVVAVSGMSNFLEVLTAKESEGE